MRVAMRLECRLSYKIEGVGAGCSTIATACLGNINRREDSVDFAIVIGCCSGRRWRRFDLKMIWLQVINASLIISLAERTTYRKRLCSSAPVQGPGTDWRRLSCSED